MFSKLRFNIWEIRIAMLRKVMQVMASYDQNKVMQVMASYDQNWLH